ncbi:MAG: TolC family protein [Chitinophagaceae bacterium]|nr:TolC family protein [Oligoflexus sp.]
MRPFYRFPTINVWSRIILLLGLGLSGSATAQIRLCPDFTKPNDILDCAMKHHPELIIADGEIEQARLYKQVAALRPNPELSNQTLAGDSNRQRFYSEFNLLHTVETGGKLDARVKKSEAELSLKEASKDVNRFEIYRALVLDLYRLRQIQDELLVIDDVVGTYRTIEHQLALRPVLSPDQRAAVANFQVAKGDFEMKKLPLIAESEQHLSSISLAIGRDFLVNTALLPKKYKKWPTLPTESGPSDVRDVRVTLAKAYIDRASAEVSLTETEASSDFRIGPSIQYQRQDERNNLAIGINVAVALPIFHRNEASLAYAGSELINARVASEAARVSVTTQKNLFVRKYNSYLAVLKKLPSIDTLKKKHHEVEKLFSDGFINGSPVIDIHNQIFEYVKSQDEMEMSMVESLLRIYAFDGKLMEIGQ